MSNELTTVSNTRKAVTEYTAQSNPFLDAAAGVGDFFGKRLSINGNTGKIHIGPKDDEEYLESGTELVVDLFSAEHGHICWVDEEPVEELMEPIAAGRKLARIEDLPDHGPYMKHEDGSEDGWSIQFRFRAYDEKTGEKYTFQTMSKSGVRSVKKLLKAYGEKFPQKIGKDGAYKIPVVVFDVTGFKIKDKPKLGTKYSPDFEIVDWVEASKAAAFFDAGNNPDDYEDEDDDNIEVVTERAKRTNRDNDDDVKETKKEETTTRRRRASEDKEDTKSSKSTKNTKRDEEEEETPSRSRRRDEDSSREETSSRSRRDADTSDDRSARRRREENSNDNRRSSSTRRRDAETGRRRDEDSGRDDRSNARRTTVRHAEPQDADDAVDNDASDRRASARGRRGRRGE